MTKEEARNKLEDFIGDITDCQHEFSLPVFDQNIRNVSLKEYDLIEEYSFRYLLQIAYDLKEK